MDSLLSSFFFFARLYLGTCEMETWFLGRDHVISTFFLHGCFSSRTRIKKKRRRKRISKERGQVCLFVNRESVITAKMCTGGDRWAKFPSNYSLGSQLSFTTSLKRIFRALIAKGRHSSSSDDGPSDALLFTSLFVFYNPRCFFPHYFVTRSTL